MDSLHKFIGKHYQNTINLNLGKNLYEMKQILVLNKYLYLIMYACNVYVNLETHMQAQGLFLFCCTHSLIAFHNKF